MLLPGHCFTFTPWYTSSSPSSYSFCWSSSGMRPAGAVCPCVGEAWWLVCRRRCLWVVPVQVAESLEAPPHLSRTPMYLSHLPSACPHAANPRLACRRHNSIARGGGGGGSGEMRNSLLEVIQGMHQGLKKEANNMAGVNPHGCEIKSLQKCKNHWKVSEGKL